MDDVIICVKTPLETFVRILNAPLAPLQYQNILPNPISKTDGLDLTAPRLLQVELTVKK